jgi:hypothetical protein
MSRKRDSKHYLKRLERDHPAVYADHLAGKYKTVRSAASAAGLIHLPTRLDALKREWKKATAVQKVEFLRWVKSEVAKAKGAGTGPIADSKGRLRADVATFISRWLLANRARPARIMKELGFSGFDTTLFAAVSRRDRLRREVVDKLAPWLASKGFPKGKL